MEPPLAQTSRSPQNGPLRTKNVVDPIVDDLAELFDKSNELVAEVNRLMLEIKKLQNAPPNAGVEGGGSGSLDYEFSVDLIEAGVFVRYTGIPAETRTEF